MFFQVDILLRLLGAAPQGNDQRLLNLINWQL